jgi:hypothetical protein
VAGFCEHGNGDSYSGKSREFLDDLSDSFYFLNTPRCLISRLHNIK